MNNKTILITGVAGLLGSRLAEWIQIHHPKATIIGVDDLSGGFKENIPMGITFYRCNINDSIQLNHIFQNHSPNIVYHFAAYAAEGLSPFIRKYNYINNTVGTASIINECIKHSVDRLVFASSAAVYGKAPVPYNEDSIPNPIDPYGVAKYACELDIQIANEQHGLDYCIIRPHNVYGRNQNIWDCYRNFIGIAMYKLITGSPITIYGDGSQTRAFSEMEDMLEPLHQAGVSPLASRQIINLGGEHLHTIKHVAETISQFTGNTKGAIIHLAPRHEITHSYCTSAKSVALLNFKHTIDIKTGLERMWNWVLNQPMRHRFVWGQYEIEKGIYPYWQPESLNEAVTL